MSTSFLFIFSSSLKIASLVVPDLITRALEVRDKLTFSLKSFSYTQLELKDNMEFNNY
jgi:hypothetical protein